MQDTSDVERRSLLPGMLPQQRMAPGRQGLVSREITPGTQASEHPEDH
jgi:hypothetical protein